MADVENVRVALAELRERLSEAEQSLRAVARAELDAEAQDSTPTPALLRAAQQRLLADERLLRAVFDGTLDAMLLVGDDGSCLEVNPAACALFGRAREELLGRNLTELGVSSSDAAAPPGGLRGLIRTSGHFPLLRPNRSTRRVEYSTTPGILPGLHLLVLRDVTEQLAATEALRRSEERLRTVIHNAPLILFALDDRGVFTFCDGQGLQNTGLSTDEVVGKSIFQVLGETPPDLVPRALAGETVTWNSELGGIPFETRLMPLRDAKGHVHGAIGILTDLTERRRAERALHQSEEQLRQAQKLEALGSLAGGVAHDFNNLLSIILSQVALLLDDLEPNDPLASEILLIRRAGERGAELTRQLLAFSRQQILQPRMLDLSDTILGMDKMLRRLIREDIGLSLISSSGLGKVKADPGQIEQVIMNLVVNARDAMPQGGTLKLQTKNVVVDASHPACIAGARPGPYALLIVNDSGVGMRPEVKARIFEPFFTTKGKGKGTGLGLSTVFGIIQQSGGHIGVQSEPGAGTTFEIYLPIVEQEAALETSSVPAGGTLRGSETILLVEDDEEVRTTASRILRRNGYNVLEARNGGEALLISEQYASRIHLVVTDVVMPLMNGRQLAERLGAAYPNMKFLFMSGYTDDLLVRHRIHGADIAFVHKPLTPATFAKKVREVLDAGE